MTEQSVDLLVLSPHLDDGALSCGGSIHRLARDGGRVSMITVFTGDIGSGALSPIAAEVLHYMGLEQPSAMATRRREDERACELLGAEPVHWPFLESVFRHRPAGGTYYQTRESIFGQLVAEDAADLVPQLIEKLEALPAASRVVAPLAVGGHVDHLALRGAAESVFGERLSYYEDFPYVRRRGALGRALGNKREWRSESWPVDAADLEAKIAAIDAYRSQVVPLFRSRRRMRSHVLRFARKRSGERFWQRRE